MRHIYLHIPFCLSKCHYCDFYSLGWGRQVLPEQDYLQSVRHEVDRWVSSLWITSPPIQTIYFGGGTPSLLSPQAVAGLLRQVERLGPLADDVEVTLEVNPKTADKTKLLGFRRAGVNRLSMGVQSLDDELLERLGRAHTGQEALAALEQIFAAGFTRVNVDLMYGLPDQQIGHLQQTLEGLADYPLTHLSGYELIIEEETPFAAWHRQGLLGLPPDGATLKMRQALQEFAAQKGMRPYEISNYAVPGEESRHNLAYWDYADFIGLGAGAVSFLSSKNLQEDLHHAWGGESGASVFGYRLTNPRDLSRYRRSSGDWSSVTRELISYPTASGEYMMMGLRRSQGIHYDRFTQRLGLPFPEAFIQTLRWGSERGWVAMDETGCRLTPEGWAWSNEILQKFL